MWGGKAGSFKNAPFVGTDESGNEGEEFQMKLDGSWSMYNEGPA